MDSYTLALLSVLVLAILALGAHAIFSLYVSEGELRETIKEQGEELIRLGQRIDDLATKKSVENNTSAEPDIPDLSDSVAPDAELTLEELISRYERDEAESWRLINESNTEATTLPRYPRETATA